MSPDGGTWWLKDNKTGNNTYQTEHWGDWESWEDRESWGDRSPGGTGSEVLLDHVGGVRSGAAAAIGTQQTVHVCRVVGQEVPDFGSTLQTPQTVSMATGHPARHATTVTRFLDPPPPQSEPDLLTGTLWPSGLLGGDLVTWTRIFCGSALMFTG